MNLQPTYQGGPNNGQSGTFQSTPLVNQANTPASTGQMLIPNPKIWPPQQNASPNNHHLFHPNPFNLGGTPNFVSGQNAGSNQTAPVQSAPVNNNPPLQGANITLRGQPNPPMFKFPAFPPPKVTYHSCTQQGANQNANNPPVNSANNFVNGNQNHPSNVNPLLNNQQSFVNPNVAQATANQQQNSMQQAAQPSSSANNGMMGPRFHPSSRGYAKEIAKLQGIKVHEDSNQNP